MAGPLYANTINYDDLLDNSGVDAFPPITSALTWEPAAFPDFEREFHEDSGHSDAEQEQYRAKLTSSERQLTVKGRSIIRKYLTEASPVVLPAGHSTVAFNEGQIHAILRTIADESVIRSYHKMKSLLLHATQGAPQHKRKSLPRRCASIARQYLDSSGDESIQGGCTTNGCTSSSINSDEDPYQLGSISGTDVVNYADPISRTLKTSHSQALNPSRAETVSHTFGSGYSSTDYQPLSTLGRTREMDAPVPSPPRRDEIIE